MSVAEWKQHTRSGFVRTNRWKVEFNFPSVAGISGQASGQASVLAKTADVPDSIIGEITVTYRGKDFFYPGDRTVNQYPITFLATQDMAVHNAFLAWSNALSSRDENIQQDDFNNLVSNLTMNLLDSRDNVIRRYTLKDAWPVEVGTMSGDQSAKDSIAEYTVTFRYLDYSVS